MGVIKQRNSAVYVLLNSVHLLGRNALAVNTFISATNVSRIHARLIWQNQRWYLQDHSTNGTLINNKFVNQAALPIHKDDVIKFGTGEETEWVLLNDDPPASYFRAVQHPTEIRTLFPRPGIPALDHPDLSIYFSAGTCWQLEREGTIVDLEDGDIVHFEDMDWNFCANGIQFRTPPIKVSLLATSHFAFTLSADEERVHLEVLNARWQLDLGERVHHFMALVLARQMVADLESGVDAENRGWMEMDDLTYDISREIRREIDDYHANVLLYRLRKQLKASEPYGYLFTDCIERRKGRLRFAYPYFRIAKESQTLFESLPVDSAPSQTEPGSPGTAPRE